MRRCYSWRIIVWNVTFKNLTLPENKLVFRFSNRQEHALLCWQNDGKNLNLFHLFNLFLLRQWRNNEKIIRAVYITFDLAQRLINQNFLKAGRQNCNKVL